MIKSLKPLVLDSDTSSSRKITDSLEKICNHVYVQNNAAFYRNELVQVRPDILFINLMINQREESFGVLDWLGDLDKLPLVYGYTDELNPDLAAHAIENGFLHVFNIQTGVDELASVIGGHFKESEALIKDLACFKINPPFSAELELELSLIQIDENGFTFKSPHYISKGTTFNLIDPVVKEIFNENQIPVMVIKTSQYEDDQYYIYVEPKDVRESGIALRRFIMSKK